MHRALPPAPAPQPACAIARPPARGLPRAISRFQGGRTSLSLPARPPPGPRNPDDQRGATLQPAPLRRGGPPAYPGSRAPEPRPPSVLRRASELRPALLTAGRRVTRPRQPRRPGTGVMTSRRRVEAAVAIATRKLAPPRAAPEEAIAGISKWLLQRTVTRSLEGMGLRGTVLLAPCATAPRGMASRQSSLLDGPPPGTSP